MITADQSKIKISDNGKSYSLKITLNEQGKNEPSWSTTISIQIFNDQPVNQYYKEFFEAKMLADQTLDSTANKDGIPTEPVTNIIDDSGSSETIVGDSTVEDEIDPFIE